MNRKHLLLCVLFMASYGLAAQFAILVGVYPQPCVAGYFDKLGDSVKMLRHQDGYYHYRIGSFKTYDQAELRLARIRNIGFDKASILDLEEMAILEANPCPYELEALPAALNTWYLPFLVKSRQLQPISKDTLACIAKYMRANQYLKVTITGHTDNEGSATENMKLSEERTREARNYLIDTWKIAGDRINAQAEGESNPIVPNTDQFNVPIAQYQALNNRVTVTLHL
jgi:OmpA family